MHTRGPGANNDHVALRVLIKVLLAKRLMLGETQYTQRKYDMDEEASQLQGNAHQY